MKQNQNIECTIQEQNSWQTLLLSTNISNLQPKFSHIHHTLFSFSFLSSDLILTPNVQTGQVFFISCSSRYLFAVSQSGSLEGGKINIKFNNYHCCWRSVRKGSYLNKVRSNQEIEAQLVIKVEEQFFLNLRKMKSESIPPWITNGEASHASFSGCVGWQCASTGAEHSSSFVFWNTCLCSIAHIHFMPECKRRWNGSRSIKTWEINCE